MQIKDALFKHNPELAHIISAIAKAGGVAYAVGGTVRDYFLSSYHNANFEAKDLDIEVHQLPFNQLKTLLKKFGRVDEVGKSFGVLKFHARSQKPKEALDFSLPRTEIKTGRKHNEFSIEVDHQLGFEKAAIRRDFTINAMGISLHDFSIQDPFGGIEHIKSKTLIHTCEKTFIEDPLRVLRGFQFVSRFGLKASPETIALCGVIKDEFHHLSKQRIWEEFKKWALRASNPGLGLLFLRDCEWLEHFPELHSTLDTKQDPSWHPEGDVFIHTVHTCDAAACIADRDKLAQRERLELLFASLLHDIGKPATTSIIEGKVRALGHCQLGAKLVPSFLDRLGSPHYLYEPVAALVKEHLAHASTNEGVSRKQVKRLSYRLGKATMNNWARLVEADVSGRPPLPAKRPLILEEFLKIYNALDLPDNHIKPIVLGRHLIHLGYKPSKHFKPVLEACFEAQLDDLFETEEEGLKYLKQLIEQDKLEILLK